MNDSAALVAQLADRLRTLGWRLACAESCTGGLIAAACTELAGSSDWFERGVVSYSNAAKVALLEVPQALLEACGAVSEPVARAMAEGIAARAKTHVGVGITGIAGPGGGTPEKPVGTVVIAVTVNGETRVRTLKLFGGREMIKFQSAQAAMNMLRLMMMKSSG